MKKIIYGLTIGLACGIILMQTFNLARLHKVDREIPIGKVRILNDYINVRRFPTASSNQKYQVLQNETYDLLEIYDEDFQYVWYRIVYGDRNTGWIASDIKSPWVEEIK